MSDPAATAQCQQATQRSVAKTALTLPFRLFGVLCGSLLVSIVMEWIGMHFFWPDQGWRHAEAMLQYELNQLSSHFTRSLIVQEPGRSAAQLVEIVHEWLLVKSGVQSWARSAAEQLHADAESQSSLVHYYAALFWVQLKNHLLAAAYATLVFLVRLVVITLTLPLVFLAAFVGLIDGLVRRDVRRFGAGRESGFIYHRARAALMPLLVLPWVLYLALPVSVSPLLILMPGAVVLGAAVCIVAAKFKKYL